MPATDVTDEQLLTARDAASFERFYVRHVDAVLAYFSRRTRDPELSADLCAETFAAALASRHRFRPGEAPATAWLFGIGSKKLADASAAATPRCARGGGSAWSGSSSPTPTSRASTGSVRATTRGRGWTGSRADQRSAVTAHVIDERPYGEIAVELDTSEAVVRKRVSRGLAAMRTRMGARR